ncbi:MAG: hypothetical protein FJ164_02945 [Gammaproteobacteria bacterium]|nr:hypothetical protein [Gammaproteobacteria bacterium]
MRETIDTLPDPDARHGALLAGLLSLAVLDASAGEPFAFDPPPFLGRPEVVRAATGNTWQFGGDTRHPSARLLITLAEIPAGMSEADTTACAEAFLEQIRRRRRDAFWQPETPALRLGNREVASWRWAGSFDQVPATGLVACTSITGRFLAVAFEDSISGAPQSFPAIRRALDTLDPAATEP